MKTSGAAGLDITIVDYSVLINTALKGKTGYLVQTERGEPGKLYDIGSVEQYTLELGGLLTTSDDPLYCHRALQAKGRLVICPVGKYINPTDKTTLSGVKASRTLTQSTASAVGATATTTVSGTATVSGTVDYIVKRPGMADVLIADNVAVSSADTATVQAAAAVTAINAGTGTHGYSAANVAGALTVTAPTSLGAWGRNLTLLIVPSDSAITFSTYSAAFTGGSDTTVNTGTLVATAKAKGTGYNKVTLEFRTAASNDTTKYDMFVGITDGTVPTEEYTDIPKLGSDTGMPAKIASILAESRLLGGLVIHSTYVFQPTTTTLAGGTDGTALVVADYIGNQSQQTNVYAFDNNDEITKICIPGLADGTTAKALADYVDGRKDIMGLHRTPINLSSDKVIEYRKGTGAYSHVPINSWRNLMFAGGLSITHPVTLKPYSISEIGDVTGIIANKDNTVGEWFSPAGKNRGLLSNGVLDVLVNVGTAALASQADNYQKAGINPVVKDSKNDIFLRGNATLYNPTTPSLLQKQEVAELLVFVYRSLRELIPFNLFDPNDTETWRAIYKRVTPFIFYLIDNRALWNKKEDVDLWYQGDQHVIDIKDAVINSSTNVDAGAYKFNLILQPKVSLLYINTTVAVTNSGIDLSDITI